MADTYTGTCYCGAATVTVEGPPLMAGLCHCYSCRKWHAAPINAFAAWPAEKVVITGDVIETDVNPVSVRTSCAKCGSCIANGKPKRGTVVVYPMALAGSNVPYKPTLNLFYEERVMDVADGLPKFVNGPKAIGGSGEKVAEPERSGWRV
ncbi:MAG: GFA family protein [Pseudomonadota bacterium]